MAEETEISWQEREDIRIQQMLKELAEPFPESAIAHRDGFSYVEHDIVRRRLSKATGGKYSWTVRSYEIRQDGVVAPAKDKRKQDEEYTPQVMIVLGDLTIDGLGTRSGIGVQALRRSSGEDMYKSAESDAIKRAAMAFLVGIDLYGTDKENGLRPKADLLTDLVNEVKRIGRDRIVKHSTELFKIGESQKLDQAQLTELLTWAEAQPI